MRRKAVALIMAASMLCVGACGNGGDPQGSTQKADAVSEAAEVPELVQPEMKGELSVSVYQSEEWLDMAVQMFEKKYPDMKVTVTPFYTGEDSTVVENGGESLVDRPAGQTKEDYATWLNTQLISGDAGDIVITSDGLAVDKYRNMGVFEDLAPYLAGSKEFNDDDYYMNIFEAYKTESGALYQFPVSAMACPLYMFDTRVVEESGTRDQIEGKALTWQEAVKLAQQMYDNSSLSGVAMPEARTILGNIFTKEVVDSVDYDNGQVNLKADELKEVLDAFDEFGYYNIYAWDPDSIRVFGLDYTADVENASMVLTNNEYVAAQWKQSDGKVHLSPYFTKDFGINSKSENKALAWEFLRFLLSDDVQTLPSFPYAGINKNGLKARVENYCETAGVADQSDAYLKLVGSWIACIDGYEAEDTDLIQIGDGILSEYMDGSLSEDEAIDEVKFRLEQYLSE